MVAHLVDGANARMIEPRRDAGLALEPFELLEGEARAAQGLDRDLAAERQVLGPVDDALSAPADLLEDPVMPDLPPPRGFSWHGLLIIVRSSRRERTARRLPVDAMRGG